MKRPPEGMLALVLLPGMDGIGNIFAPFITTLDVA